VISALHEPSTRRATSFSFAHGTCLFSALFVVRETRVTSKVLVTFRTGDSIARECARGVDKAVARRLVAGVRDVTCTCLVAPFTHVLSSHGTSKLSDHVIMSLDIIIKYIKYFSGVYLPLKYYVIAVATAVHNYLILPKVFLETD